MSEQTKQILRTGLTPVWGMASGVATASKTVSLLLTSANVSTNVSEYEQVDSEGRKCGYLCYDCEQSISLSGNILFSADADSVESVCQLFKVGSAVTDTNAKALLDLVRITKLNGTQTSTSGTYVCKSFNVSQSNTDAVSFDAEITYYGFSDANA